MLKNRRLSKHLFKKAAYPLSSMMPLLDSWFKTAAGKELLRQEQAILAEQLPLLFGYHLVQLGVQHQTCLFEASKVGHKVLATTTMQANSGVVVDEDMLPLATESVDVMLLHHLLEYSQRPHQVVNEVARAVVPSGYIVIVGMNPFSFLGLWSIFGRFRKKSVWSNRLLSVSRLVDWLTLLGFSLQSVHFSYYKPPISRICLKRHSLIEKVLHYFQFPVGGCYILVAKKEVSTITPIKPLRVMNHASLIPMMEPSLYTPPTEQSTNQASHD